MDKLVELQTALRAIETGQRLEPIDSVPVRQVLLQSHEKSQETAAESDAKGLYCELLALRKATMKAHARQKATCSAQQLETDLGARRLTDKLSPKKKKCSKLDHKTPKAVEDLTASRAKTTALMHAALIAQEKDLRRSHNEVARADADLREELSRAEKILPSKFLFERNLVSNRSLEAAHKVLQRFQHHLYKSYYCRWVEATLKLRLQIQRQAVARIVQLYRGHQGRQQARQLRKELCTMQAQQRQLLTFRIKYRASQASKLQMVWRRFLRHRAIKQRQARQSSARLLQRAFRNGQRRNQSLVSVLTNARKVFVAISLQKLYRGHRVRLQLQRARQQRQQEERVQLTLLRSMSKQARAVWMIERLGAGYLILVAQFFLMLCDCTYIELVEPSISTSGGLAKVPTISS